MPPTPIPATFWRGGTSRGLLLRASALAPFSPRARDRIIYQALGTPDPDGRQIDGLGGGVSSLSKVAIVGVPGEGVEDQLRLGRLPGVEWADEGRREGMGEWDVVYRFGQVAIREEAIDWTASCGNLLSAVALASVSGASPLVPYTTLFLRAKRLPQPPPGQPLMLPLNILSASNGAVMRAKVPLDPLTLQVWEPEAWGGVGAVQLAGVPGEAAGIEVEMPLEGGAEVGLVTRKPKDVVVVDGHEITISVVSSGLPNFFVPLSSLPDSLNLPCDFLTLPSSAFSSHPSLLTYLEHLRATASAHFNLPLSAASPKVCLISPLPPAGYQSSSAHVSHASADLIARTISAGDPHATIPGTTLGALNLALGTPGTVVHELVAEGRGTSAGEGEVVEVRAAHAAGVSSSRVRFGGEGSARKAEGVVMWRTAREIMRGEVLVDERRLLE